VTISASTAVTAVLSQQLVEVFKLKTILAGVVTSNSLMWALQRSLLLMLLLSADRQQHASNQGAVAGIGMKLSTSRVVEFEWQSNSTVVCIQYKFPKQA
jgi:hypothetical protein